jgi:hypothetical protein
MNGKDPATYYALLADDMAAIGSADSAAFYRELALAYADAGEEVA